MKLDQRPVTPPPAESSALAPRAVLVGVGVAAVMVLVMLLTLAMRPGGPGGGGEFFGGWLASHHSHSGGHHSKKKKKHKGSHGDSHTSDGSDSSGGDSNSGSSTGSGGSSGSSTGSGGSSGSSTDSSTVDSGGAGGTSVLGAGAPAGAGTGASLSCSQVVSDVSSLQQAVNSDPGGVICLQAPGSSSGSGPLGGVGSTLNQAGGSLGDTVGQVGGSLGTTVDQTGSSLGHAVGNAKNAISGGASKILTGAPKQTVLHTTGYSYQDNQGGNNSIISCGIIHKTAGGTGTYDDPITVAVPGHAGKGTQMPCGTRIYVPKYQKYFIVEDTGATDYQDADHIDIYVDGEGYSKSQSDKCMDPVTTDGKAPVPAILNPPAGEQVVAGPITQGDRCDVADAGSGGGHSSDGD